MISCKEGNTLDQGWLIPATGWSCSVGRARGGFWELWCTGEQPSIWTHAAVRCQTAPPEHPSWSTSHISECGESKTHQLPLCDIFPWYQFVFKTCDKTRGADQPWVGVTEGGGSALDVVGCPLKCCCLQCKTSPIPESTGQSPARHCYTHTYFSNRDCVSMWWNVFVLLTQVSEFPTMWVTLAFHRRCTFHSFLLQTCSSKGPQHSAVWNSNQTLQFSYSFQA